MKAILVSILLFASSAHAVECFRDIQQLPPDEFDQIERLFAGEVAPEVAIERFNGLPCAQDMLAAYAAEGWTIDTLSAALFNRAWGDEGWVQTYLVSVPLRKDVDPPAQIDSMVVHFYYTVGWPSESVRDDVD